MSAQNSDLIYLPTSYIPSFEEAQRLDEWQRQWKLWRAELRHEFDIKGFTGYERMISLEKFHQGCRKNWQIFQGGKFLLALGEKSG